MTSPAAVRPPWTPWRFPAALVGVGILAATAACEGELSLPPVPTSTPELLSFRPAAAYADQAVVITLAQPFEGSISVRFGASAPIPAEALSSRTLSARVPLDATSGALTLEHGTAASNPSGDFHFLGRGHLRDGRFFRRQSLRPTTKSIVASGVSNTVYALISSPAPVVQVMSGGWIGTYPEIDGASPIGMSLSESNTALAILGYSATASCAGAAGRSLRVNIFKPTADYIYTNLPQRSDVVCIDVAAAIRDAFLAFSLNGDAPWMLNVATDAGMDSYFVDPSQPAPPAPALHLAGTSLSLPSPLGQGRFVFIRNDYLYLASPDQAGSLWPKSRLPLNFAAGEHATAVATVRSGLIAIGTTAGRVLLASNGDWPPRFEASLDPLVLKSTYGYDTFAIRGLAFSPDGAFLAISQFDRVLVFQRDGSTWRQAYTAAELVSPSRLTWSVNEMFVATTAEGGAGVSVNGGGITRFAPSLGLESMTATTCPGGTEAVAVAAGPFGIAKRLDFSSLDDVCPAVAPRPGRYLWWVSGSPQSPFLFTAWEDGSVARTSDKGEYSLRTELFTRGEGALFDVDSSMRLSADGSRLLVVDSFAGTATVLEADSPEWASAPPLLKVPLLAAPRTAMWLGSTRLALTTGDLETLAATSVTFLEVSDASSQETLTLERPSRVAAFGEDLFIASVPDASGVVHVSVYDSASASVVQAGELQDVSFVWSVAVAPDGTRLYVFFNDKRGSGVLASVRRTGSAYEVDSRMIRLPAAASAIRMGISNEGGTLVALDSVGNAVWSLE